MISIVFIEEIWHHAGESAQGAGAQDDAAGRSQGVEIQEEQIKEGDRSEEDMYRKPTVQHACKQVGVEIAPKLPAAATVPGNSGALIFSSHEADTKTQGARGSGRACTCALSFFFFFPASRLIQSIPHSPLSIHPSSPAMILNPLQNQVGGHEGVLSMGEENEIIVKPSLPQEHQFYEETAALHPELAAWMPVYYGSLTLARPTVDPKDSSAEGGAPTIKALNGYALTELLSFEQSASDLLQKAHAQTLTEEGEGEETTKGDGDEGSEKTKVEGEDECLCLENLSHGFKKPCVLDLKLGTQLYDDNASEEKKVRLGAVAANTTSGPLGIRLTGFQVTFSFSFFFFFSSFLFYGHQ